MKRALPHPRADLSGRVAWHYTIGARFLKICDAGVLRTAHQYVPRGERLAVWFTLSEQWEETANKSLRNNAGEIVHLDREQTRIEGGGLIRFGIDAGICHAWHTYIACSGINPKLAKAMYETAVQAGSNPERDWLVHFGDLPKSTWLRVQSEEAGTWVDVPPED